MEAEEAAARAIEQAKQILMGVGTSVNSLILEGHPAEEIVRASEELGADLVVVGAKGMTSYQMFLLGSVSQKVIKYAPCSVLVARPAESLEQPTITRILLATDGSENAIEASRFLSPFRLRDDAEITILHVLHHRHGWIPRSGFTEKALEQVEQVHLESAKRLVENARANLHTDAKIALSIKEGDPAEQILKTGSEIDADLIVMGSAGLSGIKLFLLGSVAQKVSRYSDRSVMLVKLRRTSSHGERM
jgi:nucleotide-binding universal stress UspA family protein